MEIIFTDAFVKSLKKHSALKTAVKKKVDMIIENPVVLGEPLKGNFRGYLSAPVKKNFLIIYLYCSLCRRKNDNVILLCANCKNCPDETLKFIDIGPHQKVYKKD